MLVSAHARDVFWQNEDYELVDLRLHLDVANQGLAIGGEKFPRRNIKIRTRSIGIDDSDH